MSRRLAVIVAAMAASIGAAMGPQQTTTPLNLVILVDVTSSLHLCPGGVAGLPSSTASGSGITKPSMIDRKPIPPAVDAFPLKGLLATDRVRVAAIARKVAISEAMPGDSSNLHKAWRALFEMPPVEWLGPSPIWDATGAAVKSLGAAAGTRVVILITDGQATGNRQSYLDVAFAAKAAGVPIVIVGEETPLVEQIGKNPLEHLREMANISGGSFFFDQAIASYPCFRRDPGKYLGMAIQGLR